MVDKAPATAATTTPAPAVAAPAPAAPVSAPVAPAPVAAPVAPADEAEVERAAGREPKPVPYDRFREVVSGKKAAEVKLAEIERAHAAATARIAALETEIGQVRSDARKATAQAELGVTDASDVAIFISAYDKAHEKTDAAKRPTMVAWRDSLANDEKAAAESGLPTSWRKAYLTPAQPTKPGQPQGFSRDAGVQQARPVDYASMTQAEKVALYNRYARR